MTFRTRIERLGHLGDGIAPGPVFVTGALPGEDVTGTLAGNRLTNVKITTPSPDRVRPVCRHYTSCGGCALQHATDGFVAEWKTQIVRDALAAQGLAAKVALIACSAARSRRRAVFAGRRTKKGALVGLHGRRSDMVTEVPDCQIMHPDIIASVPGLQALTGLGATRKSELTLAVTRSTGGMDVLVTGGKPLTRELRAELAGIATQFSMARLSWGTEIIATRAAPVQIFGDIQVTPPAGAFLQATEDGQDALLGAVKTVVGDARQVADLFAGCGTFALPLARGAEVHAVEGDADMLAALDAGWRGAVGLKKVNTETRDLFRRPLLASDLNRFDAVVIDPPRAGAEAQMNTLAQSDVPRIAAVSCNPVTFARDARILQGGGYELNWVKVVDQFRWSPHVELVAQLSKI